MIIRAVAPFAGILLAAAANVLAACPKSQTADGVRNYRFADGSLAMRAKLNVNPDGTAASYTKGDHGYTYIANGLALWVHGKRQSCSNGASGCRAAFLKAEALGFAKGTPEFCVFAMEVESLGAPVSKCYKGHVIGNGKGKPKRGAPLETATGGSIEPYISTTALRHTINGAAAYIDSAKVPAVVVPDTAGATLGKVVWVRALGREAFAVVGDIGPRFGEGSIALHQLLRHGRVVEQKPGPIPADKRCTQAELELAAPYQSRPDAANDKCRPGRTARGAADIRAYAGIESADFILLEGTQFERRSGVVTVELTPSAIATRGGQAGYTAEKLKAMSACLDSGK